MLINPPQRSWAGSVCDSFVMSFFAAPGLMKGNMPSSTRYRAKAPPR